MTKVIFRRVITAKLIWKIYFQKVLCSLISFKGISSLKYNNIPIPLHTLCQACQEWSDLLHRTTLQEMCHRYWFEEHQGLAGKSIHTKSWF